MTDELLADLPPAVWRLLDTGLADGATNMAVDEAIMIAVAEGHSPPTLRFYGWQPPCVSVGYAQSLRAEVDLEACRRKGYDVVRRPTGGRAVLHIDELTYSVVAPRTEPRVMGDILTSYRRLSLGLIAGLRLLGCEAVQADRQDGRHEGGSAACFEVPSHYEVTALGRKLIGSAQVRRRDVVLQHGALPLCGDVSRLAEVLALPEPEGERLRARLRRRAVALDEALGKEVPFEHVAAALAEGFARTLNLTLRPGKLSETELEIAERLRTRYAGAEWTFAR